MLEYVVLLNELGTGVKLRSIEKQWNCNVTRMRPQVSQSPFALPVST